MNRLILSDKGPPACRGWGMSIVAALTGVTLFVIAGCGTSMQLGRAPDTMQLEKNLKQNVSRKDDVQQFLGTPRGSGRVMLPTDETPRDLWYYYYEEGSEKEDRRVFLFIFFRGGAYDGYFWFSSMPALSLRGMEP